MDCITLIYPALARSKSFVINRRTEEDGRWFRGVPRLSRSPSKGTGSSMKTALENLTVSFGLATKLSTSFPKGKSRSKLSLYLEVIWRVLPNIPVSKFTVEMINIAWRYLVTSVISEIVLLILQGNISLLWTLIMMQRLTETVQMKRTLAGGTVTVDAEI